MKPPLPPVLCYGKVISVVDPFRLLVRIELTSEVDIKKVVTIEGIDPAGIAPNLREEAKRGLIIMCGGKDVIVHFNRDNVDRMISRVYLLDSKNILSPHLRDPTGTDTWLLDIGAFYASMIAHRFSREMITNVLNGKT